MRVRSHPNQESRQSRLMNKPEDFITVQRYVLDEHGEPQPEPDIRKWAQWYENCERHILYDELPSGVKVSTVFLGLDHNFGMKGPPVLWETMIFGGPHNHYQDRYTSKSEAIKGHIHALRLAETCKPI